MDTQNATLTGWCGNVFQVRFPRGVQRLSPSLLM